MSKNEMRYYCGNCGGHVIDLMAVHRVDEAGLVHHDCPHCEKTGYHFQASHDTVKEVVSGGHEWLTQLDVAGSHKPSAHCPACWQMTGREKPDFSSLTVPDGWHYDDQHCHPAAGWAISQEGRKYKALLHTKSISRLEPGQPIWWATVVSTGWQMERPYEGQSHSLTELLSECQAKFDELEADFTATITDYLTECQATAQAKGYKPGWVWYQLKDKFGSDIANEVLPK